MDGTYQVIGRGKNGWHATGRMRWLDKDEWNECSSSGGTLADYITRADAGALVYDADTADTDAFFHAVVSGPMCRPDLAPNEWRSLSSAGEYNGPADLASLRAAGIGALTYIGIGIFEAMLRTVPGVRLGRVIGEPGEHWAARVTWDWPAHMDKRPCSVEEARA